MTQILFKKEDCLFTDCYCEENVWKLCESIKKNKPNELKNLSVVWFSNEDERVPMWYQKKEDVLICWDYHVILIHHYEKNAMVYDLASFLPFPLPFADYFLNSFLFTYALQEGKERILPYLEKTKFRVLSASEYLEKFASDRSHMVDKKTGKYIKEPPKYSPIATKDEKMNLPKFKDMNDPWIGEVLNIKDFAKKFGVNYDIAKKMFENLDEGGCECCHHDHHDEHCKH